jgi:uncharacterized protein YcgL (UPF0745 family)
MHMAVNGAYTQFWQTLCVYGVVSRDISIYTVIYGARMRFGPPVVMLLIGMQQKKQLVELMVQFVQQHVVF